MAGFYTPESNLEKLLKRRQISGERYALSDSYLKYRNEIPKSALYVLEAMQEIPEKEVVEASAVNNDLKTDLREGVNESILFRNQGSSTTNTNIKYHSDVDLLVFTQKFPFKIRTSSGSEHTGSLASTLADLREKCFSAIRRTRKYYPIDNGKAKAIKTKRGTQDIDIVVAAWEYGQDYYNNDHKEDYAGVAILDKERMETSVSYPFWNAKLVNKKGDATNEGLRMLIRLLKNIKEDAHEVIPIKLSSFQLTSIVYGINEKDITLQGRRLESYAKLLVALRMQLNKLVDNQYYRDSLCCPNGKEKAFTRVDDKKHLEKLRISVEVILEQVLNDLKKIKRSVNSYQTPHMALNRLETLTY